MACFANEEEAALVYDIGSCNFRAGLAGEDNPALNFSTFSPPPSSDPSSWNPPIKNDKIVDWESFDTLLSYSIPKLNPDSSTPLPFLFSEPPNCPLYQREELVQRMMETYNAPAILLLNSAILNLASFGRTTGMSVEVGGWQSSAVPVYEGVTIRHAVQRVDWGGETMGEELERLLKEKGVDVGGWGEDSKGILRDIKEKFSYIPLCFDTELDSLPSSPRPFSYTLPDGNTISLPREPFFRCVEPLFDSYVKGTEAEGLAEICYMANMRCDVDTRRHFYPNICVAGKTGAMKGLKERMEKGIISLAPSSLRIKVLTSPELSVWTGGSIVASLSNFGRSCVSKEEYDEFGPKIVKHKLLY